MNTFVKLAVAAAFLFGFPGCSDPSSDPSVEEVAADARVAATGARADVDDAEARVTAADAHVRMADAAVEAANADARVAANEDARGVADREVAPTKRIVIPSGTVLKVSLIDALGSGANAVGDRFLTNLSESIVLNGETALEKGTTIRGRVLEVEGADLATGLATIRFVLTDIVQDDQLVPITTGNGSGAGTGRVLTTRGEEVHYGPGTRFDFTLTNSVTISGPDREATL